jgi:hypothetical protein
MFDKVFGISQKKKAEMLGAIDYGAVRYLGGHKERLAYGLLVLPLALAYLWKKNHIYTIIEYDDGVDTQKIVLDFEKGANYAQSIIYKKMLDCRSTSEIKKPESDTSSHSPIRF